MSERWRDAYFDTEKEDESEKERDRYMAERGWN